MSDALQVYLDESGTHGNSPAVVVAGYVGEPTEWDQWTSEWEKTKRGRINVFHAVHCNNRSGEFSGLEEPERNALVQEMLPITPKHIKIGISIGIDMKSYRDAIEHRPDLNEHFGSPYLACFGWLLQDIVEDIEKSGIDREFHIFHEENQFKEDVISRYKWIVNNIPGGKRCSGLSFAKKSDCIPLQAADILAYETHHKIKNPSKNRKSWDSLHSNGAHIKSLYYGPKNMDHLVKTLEEMVR